MRILAKVMGFAIVPDDSRTPSLLLLPDENLLPNCPIEKHQLTIDGNSRPYRRDPQK